MDHARDVQYLDNQVLNNSHELPGIKPDIRRKLGAIDSLKAKSLFGNTLNVYPFQNGYILSTTNGFCEVLFNKEVWPWQTPSGDIKMFFDRNGGEKRFGTPQEGEISIFNDRYRLHIFLKSMLIWEKDSGAIQVYFKK